MTTSSDDEDPLGRIECFDVDHDDRGETNSHVHPVTLAGSRYRYTSQLDHQLHIDLEHRPEKVLKIIGENGKCFSIVVVLALKGIQGTELQVCCLGRASASRYGHPPLAWQSMRKSSTSRIRNAGRCQRAAILLPGNIGRGSHFLGATASAPSLVPHHVMSIQGMRILELGCGCGLVGLCFAALGADVLLTDLPDPMAMIRDNIALNQECIRAAGGSAAAQPFVWGETDVSELAPEWRAPGLVVAADVVYRRELFQPLLHALKTLGGPSTRILLAHVRRWKSDKLFFQRARKLWEVTDISDQLDTAAGEIASHSRGALRLFEFKHLVKAPEK